MTKDELEALWQKLGMPPIEDGENVGSEKWPDEWADYSLLTCSPAEDFLFCININECNAKSEGEYLWHGKYKGENLIASCKVADYDVKFSGTNKIDVKQIGSDFIKSVSSWARWFYLWYYDSEVMFGLANWNGTKRIELSAHVDWPLVSDYCRGVQEEIYPVGWQNKAEAVIEPKKFIADIMNAVNHKYQYQFERDWTFFITNGDGTIFPIKDWEKFQRQLRQASDIQVQTRLLNTDGVDFQFEVKYSYCGGGLTLWGVGDRSPWGEDFLRNCVHYHGEIEDFSDLKFSLPLPLVAPGMLREN